MQTYKIWVIQNETMADGRGKYAETLKPNCEIEDELIMIMLLMKKHKL